MMKQFSPCGRKIQPNFPFYNLHILYASLCCLLMMSIFLPVSIAAEDTVLAEGNGFRLTQGDVDKVREYYEKTPVRTNPEEYVNGAYKIKIVAHEAIVRHLDKEFDIPPKEMDTVESWLKLAELCYNKIREEYPISDLVIESYYRAFPERFIQEGESLADQEQKPLDADTRKKIRDIIVVAKNDKMLTETIAALTKKYSVQFIKQQGN